MIFYSPTDGEAHTVRIEYHPRTCFVMTKLGDPIPPEDIEIRSRLATIFSDKGINIIDANDEITGKDFLLKIWHMLLSVPLGIAIISRDMDHQTFANIFYEIGLMQPYGKEILIIKTADAPFPSDFVRTEYIEFAKDFEKKITKFIKSFFKLAEHYKFMAVQLENNPLLEIDYLKRAYLISGEKAYREEAYKIFEKAQIKGRAKNSVEKILADWCIPQESLRQEGKGENQTPALIPVRMQSTISLKPPQFYGGGEGLDKI
jgi:hypothetical protein